MGLTLSAGFRLNAGSCVTCLRLGRECGSNASIRGRHCARPDELATIRHGPASIFDRKKTAAPGVPSGFWRCLADKEFRATPQVHNKSFESPKSISDSTSASPIARATFITLSEGGLPVAHSKA